MSKVVKASSIRKAIAKNMTNSWLTSPSCMYTMDALAENIVAFRKEYNEKNNCKVSYLNIIMKMCAKALKEFPYVNSSYDFEKHEILLHEDINVGFALAHGDVLFAPNTKKTDALSLIDINNEVKRIASEVRENKFNYEDHTGGTFTITNMGVYPELEQHTPIINQPEMAILATYAIKDKPIVENGELVVKSMMKLVLVADHRVVDGKLACEFLSRIKELVEKPSLME